MSKEISIEEMVMDGFRMMRNGDYKTAKQLRNAIQEAFPNESNERVQAVMQTLARIALRMS